MTISNAIVQIYTRLGCAPDEPGYFEDFKVIRPVTRQEALSHLKLARAQYQSECFRLKLEDWNTGETEIVEV